MVYTLTYNMLMWCCITILSVYIRVCVCTLSTRLMDGSFVCGSCKTNRIKYIRWEFIYYAYAFKQGVNAHCGERQDQPVYTIIHQGLICRGVRIVRLSQEPNIKSTLQDENRWVCVHFWAHHKTTKARTQSKHQDQRQRHYVKEVREISR